MDSIYETMLYYTTFFFPDSVGLAGFFIRIRYGPYVMCVLQRKHLMQSCFEHETFAAFICSETWRHYNKWSQNVPNMSRSVFKARWSGVLLSTISSNLVKCRGKKRYQTEVQNMEKKHLLLPNREGFDKCWKLSCYEHCTLAMAAMHMFHTQWFCSLRRCSLRGP